MLTLDDLSGAQAEDTAAETWPELTMSYKNLPAGLLDVKGRIIPLEDNCSRSPCLGW